MTPKSDNWCYVACYEGLAISNVQRHSGGSAVVVTTVTYIKMPSDEKLKGLVLVASHGSFGHLHIPIELGCVRRHLQQDLVKHL